MTKTIKIQSKRHFCHDTPRDIAFGTYAYCPASSAVTAFTKAAFMFNDGLDSNLTIRVVVKYTDAEQAKIKLKGKRDSINTCLNRLIAETKLLQNFDIRL